MQPAIRLLSGIAFLMATCDLVVAADPASNATPPSIDTLIEQLGHKQYRIRQAAGKALEARGEEALPILQRLSQHPDLETRRKIEVLTEKIEHELLLTPKRVTLKANNWKISEILDQITRQTGYQFEYENNQGRDNEPRLNLDLKNVTYWEAMQALCNSAGLSYNADEQESKIYLYRQDTVSPYTSIRGPFRFVASNFNYNRYVNLANLPRNGIDLNQRQDNLGFMFFIQSEPKTPLLQVGTPKLTKAEDENGASLMPRTTDDEQNVTRFYDFNSFRSFQHQAALSMHKANKDSRTAKIIRGTVTVTMLASTRPDVVLDNLTVGMKKKISGVGTTAEVDVEAMVEQNKSYTVTLLIRRRDAISPNDYNWINTIQQKLDLVDDKGRKYICQGIGNIMDNSITSVHGTFRFVPPPTEIGKPVKLMLNRWLSKSQELEFEFKDLPLP